jgi:hypothetical protein
MLPSLPGLIRSRMPFLAYSIHTRPFVTTRSISATLVNSLKRFVDFTGLSPKRHTLIFRRFSADGRAATSLPAMKTPTWATYGWPTKATAPAACALLFLCIICRTACAARPVATRRIFSIAGVDDHGE